MIPFEFGRRVNRRYEADVSPRTQYSRRLELEACFSFTGVLILQNAQGLFLSQELARANYRAGSAEILHDTLLGDSTWVSRGFSEFPPRG